MNGRQFIYQYTAWAERSWPVGLGAWLLRQGYVGLSGRPLAQPAAVSSAVCSFSSASKGTCSTATMAEAGRGTLISGGWERQEVLGTSLDYAIMVIYFLAMLVIGTWFGRHNKSTKDFFFGGQRFSWWLIAFSLVATTIGSYSFVKYSKVAFTYGLGLVADLPERLALGAACCSLVGCLFCTSRRWSASRSSLTGGSDRRRAR